MFYVNAQRTLRQIAQMAHAGLDLIRTAEVLPDRLGLGGRLDDHEAGLFFHLDSSESCFTPQRKAAAGERLHQTAHFQHGQRAKHRGRRQTRALDENVHARRFV